MASYGTVSYHYKQIDDEKTAMAHDQTPLPVEGHAVGVSTEPRLLGMPYGFGSCLGNKATCCYVSFCHPCAYADNVVKLNAIENGIMPPTGRCVSGCFRPLSTYVVPQILLGLALGGLEAGLGMTPACPALFAANYLGSLLGAMWMAHLSARNVRGRVKNLHGLKNDYFAEIALHLMCNSLATCQEARSIDDVCTMIHVQSEQACYRSPPLQVMA